MKKIENMKAIEKLLSELKHNLVKVWVEEDNLRFSAPKGALTQALRTELLKHKTELMTFLSELQRESENQFPPIEPVSRNDGHLPVSFAQQRLWFLDQLEGGSATYNISAALRLEGALDRKALSLSLLSIVQRHENLHIGFRAINGTPVVQLTDNPHPLSIINLEDRPVEEQEREVGRLINEEARRPFDLSQGPLFRSFLLQKSRQSSVLLLTIHHIIFDDWSLSVLLQELSILYEAFCQGKPSPLAPLPIQYADFAHWQRQWLSGERLSEQINYWKKQLTGAPAILELPTDRPRPPIQSNRGAIYHLTLSAQRTEQLKRLSQQTGTTLFITLLSAFAILLSRYSGQTDIVIGSPIANRRHSQIESLIGFFVNTLVLRLNLEGNPHFDELLRRVKQVALGAYAHQDLPVEKLIEELQPERNLSHAPLFQVMFVLQNAPTEEIKLSGLTLTPFLPENTVAKFDLTLSLEESAQGSLDGILEYNTELFDGATIERLAGHFQTLIEGIVSNSAQSIHDLPLLTADEQHQLLVEWNDTTTSYPDNQCVHQLFEAQVEQTPEAVAVVFEDQQLSYLELNARANQLAHHLLTLGVKPDHLVGLGVERSLEMIIGLLGILKAGGAYVPLDPNYPTDRLAFMLEDSQISVLLTQNRLMTPLPVPKTTTVVYLDTDFPTISKYRSSNPVTEVQSDNLAYVIYTSGSTGQPKGVLVEHQGVCNLAMAQIQAFEVQSNSRVLQFASLNFDASLSEMVMSLCSGAQLCLANSDALLPGRPLGQLLQEQAMTHLTLPPTALAVMSLEDGSKLSHLIVAGEACSDELVAKWSKGRRFFNAYGPTEATVCATIADCSDTQLKPPIGRPLANTQIYLLDQHNRQVPIGVPGEIHIGGVGVARGYLNRPLLTTEKFIPNPVSDRQARLYKTGDLGRYLPDGNLEYLGRIDNQVKIRGFRIELGEIEAVLAQYAMVRENAVIVHEDSKNDKRLMAYFVPHNGQVIDNADLRTFIQQRLPDYMIPSALVSLEAMPLTPNAKIDRRALEKTAGDQFKFSTESFVAARTPEEELLAGIWADVLGVEPVGMIDNFFELGGHSLLATQVMSRIRDTFSVELPMRVLFESPTVPGLSEHIKRVSREEPLPQIMPVHRDEPLRLSFAQQRLWFLDQLEGQSATYNMSSAIRLEGPLHLVALEHSWREIVQRHEILRTTFQTDHEQPFQVIHPVDFWQLKVVNLQKFASDEQSHEVQRLVNVEAMHPFHLSEGPLFRITLLQLENNLHVLLLTMHHIISDGWSIGILVREFGSLYEAFCQGEPSPLSPLPIQYADFAHWQRQYLSGERLSQQRHYWSEQLAGAPALLELPTDHPRPPIQRFQGTTVNFELGTEPTHALKTLSQQQGTTLFMTLLAAFATLLSRYSGQTDIVIGSPIANRTHSQLESVIGFFVNTLVLRIDLSGNPSVEELLKRVRPVALDAYAHQDIPFEQLVEELQPERNLSHTPLFQVMLVLQNAPMAEIDLSELALSPMVSENTGAKFDLTLSLAETDNGLVGVLEYNTDIFEPATIERLTGHFQTLIEGIVSKPRQTIQELPLLTATERHQLLVEWNDTTVSYPYDQSVHQLFEAQVEKTPEAIAAVFENQQLSYLELNRLANQLAHHLQMLGVKPEVRVGICIDRSLPMVIGLLGVLKAGGAYLPLDPSSPTTRLAFMLADAGVLVLLTAQKLLNSLPEHQAQVVCLDSDWEMTISPHGDENLVSQTLPENLAYMIYTSGSTGQPKGTLITHQGLTNYLYWCTKTYPLTQGEGSAVHSSFGFDATITSLFSPLLVGKKVILVPEENEIEALSTLLSSQADVSLIKITPTHLEILSQLLPKKAKHSTHSLILGGEALLADQLSFFRTYAPQTRMINEYGPTETVVGCCVYEVSETTPHQGAVPIGRAIANTQLYLLHSGLQPVPVGVPGELYIGGAGLARGYQNRPELTAEKFLPNPFSDDPNARLYKTGDLARYLPDGNLEYLGRIDNQVKIRGFRIELGEIEAVLAQYPLVRENAVMVYEDSKNDKRLVAYLVPQTGQEIDNRLLRDFLQQRLPDYMIPKAFISLEAMPLTINGKIDRHALLKKGFTPQLLEETFVPPSTPEEELLAGIWASVLGIESVGRFDNFFDLGGHSLLATQVMSRIRDTFSVDLPLRFIFESPTVAGLSKHLNQGHHEKASLPSITPVNRDEPLVLSFAQQRLWFLDQLEGQSATYNMPTALRLEGSLDLVAFEQSLRELVQRHEILRTTFPTHLGHPLQVIHSVDFWQLNVVDLQEFTLDEQTDEVQRFVSAEAQRPFNLSKGPLFRSTLLQLGSKSYVLLLSMHHIISDGWSIGILVRDFGSLYEAFHRGEPSPLSPLPFQYADFAHWQRQWLQGEVLEQQVTYWKQQLAGSPALLELPTDHPRPPVQSFNGTHLSFSLSPQLTEQLKLMSQQTGTTLFMTLLAIFSTLLSRYSGQRDIVIGSPIAGRTHSFVEPLIGFFINTLVLRLDLSGNPSVDEVMQQARRVALEAYAHQHLPFEQLVEELQPERSLDHSPLFQVMLALQNAPMEEIYLLDMALSPIVSENSVAKFDLTLSMAETDNGLEGVFEYNTDLFERTTIERLVGHFQTLIEGIVSNPQQPIQELPLLTATERHQLLVEWNDTTADYPIEQCVHHLFEVQVEKTPEAIAVVFEDQQLTYQELNHRANQLAHHLQTLGMAPELRVGICLERSALMVIGLLGIFKAGGAYLPLEPSYPENRLAFMLEDAGVSVLLTVQKLVTKLPKPENVQRVCLDSDWEMISRLSVSNPVCQLWPSNLAYVIYTSGSTGQPKGVMISHHSIATHCLSIQNHYQLTKSDVVLQFASVNFDPSLEQIFSALLVGARLVFRDNEFWAVSDLHQKLLEHEITVINIPPAYWQQLAQEWINKPQPVKKMSLRLVIIGGDVMLPEMVKLWWQTPMNSVRLLNAYGPTETTITATFFEVGAFGSELQRMPIGHPISNKKAYVLDSYYNPVPIGVPGELYLGGIGTARGYLGRPELTADKFVPNPFGNEPNGRLYKTGDLARYLPDGNLEYLGRIDNQVKIRGFRIELGEIEAVLSQYSAVRENAVIVHQASTDNKRLVAYLVVNQGSVVENAELRGFLTERLPDYMIPSVLVTLEALPLTPNGKIDRRALSQLSVEGFREETFVAPRDALEFQLTQIWEETLNVRPIGVRDNFFELGGHSLLAVRLMAEIGAQLEKHLPLATLFQGATIEQLATILRQETEAEHWSSLVPIQAIGSKPPLFCVPGAGGNVIYLYELARHLGVGQPFYGLQAVGLDGESAPYTNVEDIAAHYLKELQTVQPQGPYLLGGHSFGGMVAFEMSQQLQKQGDKVALVAIFDTYAPRPASSNPPTNNDWDEAHWLANIAQVIGHFLGKPVDVSVEALEPLDPEDQLNYFKEQLIKVNWLPPQANIKQLHGFVEVYKANGQMPYFSPPNPLKTHVALFKTLEMFQLEETPESGEMNVSQEVLEIRNEPSWGWSRFSDGPVVVHQVPGDHLTMMVPPHVEHLAKQLKMSIEQALGT